jgi:ABC-type polysaccharide/polyol phosphate transport system ATPase subunit
MNDDFAIKLVNVKKTFWIPHEQINSIKSIFLMPFKLSKMKWNVFEALKEINLTVKRGEILGIIGRNGSGKSTLLKIVAGIYSPDQGKVIVKGRIVPFLELGVGFHPDLTARENIFLNGAILGMSKKEISSKFDEIVDFAEVRNFLDTQIKKFSSGMLVRLAFSIAIRAEGDIFILDEVLSVGDVKFQDKSKQEIFKLKEKGKTILFVSHSMESVRTFCTRAICIDNGSIVEKKDIDSTIEFYLKSLN